ncbi:hypothetical protein L7F22_061215 [Adiantum nelumboides]|nr:hypothetical protein [Adiantum nelumboides]
MEYCGGGDLGSIIKKCRKNNTLLSEDTIWTYLYQMVLALDVCHYRTNTSTSSPTSNPSPSSTTASYLEAQPPLNAILHRDLKPENVFLDSESNIKLGDFGLSKQLNSETFTNTYVGTPYYMSPELATGKSYDSKSDIWALGCIGYELGALSPPFDASNQAELTRKIKAGNVPQLPKGFSLELGSLIRQMLDLNPNRRPTTRQLLTHPQIIFAKRTLELTSLKRTLQNETIRLRDFSNSLNLKEAKLVEFERELKTREEMLSSRSNSNSNYDVQPLLSELREKEQELVERERLLREQEEILEKGNDDLDDRRADLERKWLNWRDGERLKKDEEMRKCLLERDAARNALEEHLKRSGSSSQKEKVIIIISRFKVKS